MIKKGNTSFQELRNPRSGYFRPSDMAVMLSPLPWSLRRSFARHVGLASSSVSSLRRGVNLTERYRTLENNTSKPRTHASALPEGSESAAGLQADRPVHARTSDTMADFVIPQEPQAPADDGVSSPFLSTTCISHPTVACCMSGCAVCVYDLYEEALAAYKDSVTTLRAALSARHIPEREWPAHIRTGKATPTTPMATGKSKGAVLDAFEEMERALQQKRDKRAAVEAESSS